MEIYHEAISTSLFRSQTVARTISEVLLYAAMQSEVLSFLDGIESELDRRIEVLSTLNASYSSLLDLLRQRQEQERVAAAQAELLIRNEVQSLTKEVASGSSLLNEEDEYLEAILRKAKLAKGIKPAERQSAQDGQDGRRMPVRRAKAESKDKSAEKADGSKRVDLLSEHIRSALALAEDQKRVNMLRLLVPSGERLRIETAFLSGTTPKSGPSLPFNPLFAAMLNILHNKRMLSPCEESAHDLAAISSESLIALLRRYSCESTYRTAKSSLDSSLPLSADQVTEVMTQWFVLNNCFYMHGHTLISSNHNTSHHPSSSKLFITFPMGENSLFRERAMISASGKHASLYFNMQHAFHYEFLRLLESAELKQWIDEISGLLKDPEMSKSKWEGSLRKYKLLLLLLNLSASSKRSCGRNVLILDQK